jgi:23S rRNA pseudouridine2605 synthase
MRQNGLGALTFEDARTWLEETGLCLFLPRKQFPSFVAPTFVEAVVGEHNQNPGAKTIAQAEDLLVRLEAAGVAVRLNLMGTPGDQPDFVVAAWVLPYVYALRGDRDWRRNPQLTGSRAVSPLAIQAYKLLEQGDATISQLRHGLGREVSESAVQRAITELWQQLRIIPVIAAPGKAAQWQLLRLRFQKAIAEGASTSQVTAISVLASIYLQAVIAASMEEVEMFLAPLTARSKVREVLRGLVATRQVHTISLGHAPHYYVAGTLPEFTAAPTIYASSAMPSSAQFARPWEHEEETRAPFRSLSAPANGSSSAPAHIPQAASQAPGFASAPKPPTAESAYAARPHFSRPPARPRSRKPASGSASNRAARHTIRANAARSNGSSRHATQVRWTQNGQKNGHGKHSGKTPGTGRYRTNGSARTGSAEGLRKTKNSATRSLHNGHGGNGKSPVKSSARPVSRHSGTSRKDGRPDTRKSRKPALAASAKAGNRTRYGFTAPRGQRSKKRG